VRGGSQRLNREEREGREEHEGQEEKQQASALLRVLRDTFVFFVETQLLCVACGEPAPG
jgi:hypothetical protein